MFLSIDVAVARKIRPRAKEYISTPYQALALVFYPLFLLQQYVFISLHAPFNSQPSLHNTGWLHRFNGPLFNECDFHVFWPDVIWWATENSR